MNGYNQGNLRGHVNLLIQRYWDSSSELQHGFGGGSARKLQFYADSRAGWTLDERKQVRSILIFLTHCAENDSFLPHTSMMGGHPNFIAEIKFSLPLAAAVFPKHPHAGTWKRQFMRYWNEWLYVYTRRANPRLHTQGGRWMENVACYWIASLDRAGVAAEAMIRYDGTRIFDHPLFKDLIRWTLDTLAPCEEPHRRSLPIGAHAYHTPQQVEPLGRTIDLLGGSDSALASQLLWCLTDGKEGTRPDLRSRLYTDYGAVMWHDSGGPHEAFLTIQQLNGRGYRWTTESNGALYYATRGQRWSWNGAEQNGDSFDINLIPLFNLNGKSLGAHEVDGVLYDFEFAQFYKAAGSNSAYPWRGVMMLRDDYLAVYDHVADPAAVGKFQWCNYEAHLSAEYFANPDFTHSMGTQVPRERFPLKWDWDAAPPLEAMQPGPFSVRWTGMLLPETTGDYSIVADVTTGDAVRIWLGNQLAYDSTAAAPIPVRLSASQLTDLKVEFVHRAGPARINVGWRAERLIPLQHGILFNRLAMPQIYPVKAGAGDQLHIVAPKAHEVESKSYGAVVDGKEYVFCSDTQVRASEGPAEFLGTAGYAREGQVALFEGTKVAFGGLAVECLTGEFGISAGRQANGTLAGRIAGRSGGRVRLTPPTGFDAPYCQVRIDGVVVPHTFEGAAICFDVQIAQSDDTKSYTIEAAGSE
jgi:hypothetical protein